VLRTISLAFVWLAAFAAGCGPAASSTPDVEDVVETAEAGDEATADVISPDEAATDALPDDANGDEASADDAADDAARDECLGDFPDRTVGLLANRPGAFDGYTLFAPLAATTTYLVDMCGRQVHSWTGDYRPANSVRLLEDGRLLRTGFADDITNPLFNAAAGAGGRVQLVEWDGTVSWEYVCSDDTRLAHHDAAMMPDGHVLLIAWELKTRDEEIAAGRDPASSGSGLWPDLILEVEPAGAAGGTVAWEWHVWDHLVQDFDATAPDYGVPAEHPELVDLNYVTSGEPDWMHSNSVAYSEELDQVLLSVHGFSEIWVIDHATTVAEAAGHSGGRRGRGGDLLYRWGNPRAYGAGVLADQRLYAQHDAQWIAAGLPGAGNVLVFNNGVRRRFSSVDELLTPVDGEGAYTLGPDGTYGPDGPAWTYAAPVPADFFSRSISGAQRLANGNTLICEGGSGHFFEVTSAGELVWEYVNPVTGTGPVSQGYVFPAGSLAGQPNATFRAYRFAPDFPGLAGRVLTPGDVLELPASG
jgi:hypothetical protein